ncbi:MAG: hypothetical protein J6A61_01665 [Clostridia bacterium]|nr:hypothetical protein [Clostridia bacterium]
MKKMVTAMLLACIMMVSAFSVTSYAKTGDNIGYTQYTDIIASINDYNIQSYNIDGYTAVVAEDLANYGFDVQWDEGTRSLYITRGSTNAVASGYIASKIPQSQIGKVAQNVLATDIKTYINNNEVVSYNINGKTIIYFDALAVFGKIEYSDSTRRLDLDISDGLNYKISVPQAYSSASITPSGVYFKMNSADGLQIRWFATNNTGKTINYYTTTYYMFNPVGDFAYDRYGDCSFKLKTVGPIAPGEKLLNYTSEYEAEVYDVPVRDVMLYTIFLEYSDGTSETIYYSHIGSEETGKFVL